MPHQTEKKNSVDTETRHKKMATSRILIISERRHSVHATRTGGYKNEHSENKKELMDIKYTITENRAKYSSTIVGSQ